jgi:pimeloyl-ACP methyl ester carboxylesterase
VVRPQTHYARSGDVNVAYQVVGDGPRDLVLVPGWLSNVEAFWEEPSVARFLERLASFSRLILFDKRGTGLSDRVADMPNLETRMDDVRAVMDAVGSSRAALLGYSEGGPMCALFAATYPARTTALLMIGSYARRIWAPDYAFGTPREQWEAFADSVVRDWGGPVGLDDRAPSMAGDTQFREWWARFLRLSGSPSAGRAVMLMNGEIDVRHILSAVRVPTLIVHNAGERTVPVEAGRYLARHIPDARYVELPGIDHLPFVGNADAILDEVEEFLTGARTGAGPLCCSSLVVDLDR